jgi:hypothetical protein
VLADCAADLSDTGHSERNNAKTKALKSAAELCEFEKTERRDDKRTKFMAETSIGVLANEHKRKVADNRTRAFSAVQNAHVDGVN